MADQAPLIRYVGDDWTVGPVTLYGGGVAIDLSGCTVRGDFYAPYILAPAATLTVANGGIVLGPDPTAGTIALVKVPRAVTAGVKAADRRATTFPTRTAIVVTDGQGNARTRLLILYLPLDPRSDQPPATALTT